MSDAYIPAISGAFDRKVYNDYLQVRKGIVTAVSPLTVTVSNVAITNVNKMPSYVPIVGDIVRIEVDGTAWTITDRYNTLPQAIGASVKLNTNQLVSNATIVTVGMNTDVQDAYGYGNGTTGLVVPTGHDGQFIISAHFRWENAAITNPILAIFVNSTPIVRDAPLAAAASPPFFEQHATTLWPCVAGDVIVVTARHDTGVTRTVSGVTAGGTDPTGPWLEMWRIGP